MRESKRALQARIAGALTALSAAYPDAAPQLDFTSPFELLAATILSAQCTDKQVNKVTAALFPLYGTPQKMAAATQAELEPYIKGCGLFKTKGKNLIATAKILVSEYGGEVPRERDTLTKLPGVGRKTANVVISNAFGTPAIAVDTHVFRVANRMGLADAKDVLHTEQQLMQNIPEAQWSIAHHWLIFHGRRVCSARNPKCEACTVRAYCKQALTQAAGKAKSNEG
ncbi:MAG: endonuclease III [Christensenellaceae bacterium]|jgi:endonuclease-3|nr:endonuclease III [Christensenellaceae bacterium]